MESFDNVPIISKIFAFVYFLEACWLCGSFTLSKRIAFFVFNIFHALVHLKRETWSFLGRWEFMDKSKIVGHKEKTWMLQIFALCIQLHEDVWSLYNSTYNNSRIHCLSVGTRTSNSSVFHIPFSDCTSGFDLLSVSRSCDRHPSRGRNRGNNIKRRESMHLYRRIQCREKEHIWYYEFDLMMSTISYASLGPLCSQMKGEKWNRIQPIPEFWGKKQYWCKSNSCKTKYRPTYIYGPRDYRLRGSVHRFEYLTCWQVCRRGLDRL